MKARFRHTSIVSRDWASLVRFYVSVFGCEPVPPLRELSGTWLSHGTGVPEASLVGIHLRLPGYGDDGPTLEIFQYAHNEPRPETAANREGIAHLAFEVDDVQQTTEAVNLHGGRRLGSISSAKVPGVGRLVFIYVADPEGNVIELQSWEGNAGSPAANGQD